MAIPADTLEKASPELRPFVRAAVNFSSAERQPGCLHSVLELIDFNAVHNTEHPFCIQARPSGPHDVITHGQFKTAVDGCAQWMEESVLAGDRGKGTAFTDVAPVALLMDSDVGLLIHQFALLKIGVPALILSARLSSAAILHLIETTSATALLASERLSKPIQPTLTTQGVSLHTAQPYSHFLPPQHECTTQQNGPYPTSLDSNILLLHSSGTTGLPKPIPMTHRQLVFAVSSHNFDTECEAQGPNISTLPIFHGYGLLAPLISLSVGKTTCLPSPAEVPNAASITNLIRTTNAASLMTVPFLLDDLAALPNDEGIKALSTLDFVGTGGAALSADVGDRLTAGGVKIVNFYGTTETGPLTPSFVPKGTYDWRYFRLRTDMRYEITELESRLGQRRFRLTVWPFGATEGIEVADQLIRNENHPETDFAAVGRDDDVIVLATGEKVNPVVLETMLGDCGLVKGAVAFGENRFEIGVIVEVAESGLGVEGVKNAIWPVIVEVGEKMDAFAKVSSRDSIIVAPAGVVLPRTDKGSIARKEAYALFAAEIAEVYERLDGGSLEEESVEEMKSRGLGYGIKGLIQRHLQWPFQPDEWTEKDNLFELGMNSLQAVTLHRLLLAAARALDLPTALPRDFITRNPSVAQLVQALTGPAPSQNGHHPWEEVDRLVTEYTFELGPTPPQPAVVLLTGSSGSLGSHCLAQLARSPEVSQIICLLRTSKTSPPATLTSHRAHLATKQLHLTDIEWSKVSLITIDPSAPALGLPQDQYTTLQNQVTHILHTAWPMTFKPSLSSLTSQFKFLHNLLHLATAQNLLTPRRRFIFISSIAAIAQRGLTPEYAGQSISETSFPTAQTTMGIGYADAKIVCEKILEKFAATYPSALEISIIRCGQIAGSRSHGVWSVMEQVPMLLRSGVSLGVLPQIHGTLSWLPVDTASTIITEILFCPPSISPNNTPPPLFIHLENPIRQPWSDILDTFSTHLNLPTPRIPFDEWIDRVVHAAETEGDMKGRKYPVCKLEDFYRGLFLPVASGEVILGTDNARKCSRTMREMRALDAGVVGGYVAYWRGGGVL
ncbi:acetyl-CoA synthetase-like protein [Aspergillus ellipticus CBS 707.79]|uniref:Acetyl-CoA synthetase-like protein n=1 Tax=Aspergillus ellipticus CBS 707.79 TaxID=1448320 RepID=A0A319D675_9EURO|nr:acetyl-CoA synthetase-like protein [Aspergillus ellipticus CBS 707.79]